MKLHKIVKSKNIHFVEFSDNIMLVWQPNKAIS